MRTIQGNMLRSLHSVQGFLNENADKLGGVISTGSRAMLDSAIAELEEHAATQDGRARMERGAVAIQRARRQALLRDHMAPIDRIARLLLPDLPDLVALRLPKGHPSVERLVALAGGMAEAAEPHAAAFIRTGRKPTFIADLRAAADALLHALQDRYVSRSKVRMATSALQTGMSHARKVVNVLDALMRSELANDPDLLAGWNLARHVSQPRTSHATTAVSLPEASIAEPAPEPVPAPLLEPAPEPLLEPVAKPVLIAAAWSSVPVRSAVELLIAEMHEVPTFGTGPSVKAESSQRNRFAHGTPAAAPSPDPVFNDVAQRFRRL